MEPMTLAEPRNYDELRGLLACALDGGQHVTFRASGHAFDTQSLNEHIVISICALPAITSIVVDQDKLTVTVGAAATWGNILRETAAHGLVPYIMPTSSAISAGGSVSSHSLSRFSPELGREGAHVRSLRLMTMDGAEHVCSPENNPELFLGACGGLGYVGLILEVTYELQDLRIAAGELAVASEWMPIHGIQHLAQTLADCADARGRLPSDDATDVSTQVATRRPPYAMTAVLYMNAKRQGVLTRSRYVAAKGSQLRRSIEHSPNSLLHLLLQFAAIFRWSRRLGWWFVLRFRFRKKRTAVDELSGYTFFEDGNVRARKLARSLGMSVPLRQQTYLVPWDSSDRSRSADNLASFLDQADKRIDKVGLLPSLIDVVYLGNGSTDLFYLSSSRQFSAFAVSITFEKTYGAMVEEEAALKDISVICSSLGGRVHIVKHVLAEPALMERMYPGLELMRELKQKRDPAATLCNEFLRRVFPVLAR
jgi:FAD binding domain